MLRKVARNIQQAKFYSVMGDETTDTSNKEQLVLSMKRVDDDLQVHEDFIGIHEISNTLQMKSLKLLR